jgi:hypothetical protein
MKRPFHRVNAAFSAFFAIAILSACSGGGLGSGASSGGSTVPAQQSAPAPVTGDDDVAPATAPAPQTLHPDAANPKNLAPIVIEEGGVTGEANQFTPARGDSSVGGHGQTVDNLACQTHMTVNKYHVHAYLGVIYNDKLMADPSAIGMLDPQPAVNGFTNAAKCYYSIHTHDSSGAIHIEVNRELPLSASIFTLKNVLDVWGVPHSTTRFGPFNGPVHVFVGNVPLKQTTVTSFSEYTGDYDNIPLSSHTAIFIEVGSTYYTASQLPSVLFYTEY